MIPHAPRWSGKDSPRRDDGRRDSDLKVTCLGIIAPAALVLWAAVNLLSGQAAFVIREPAGHRWDFALIWLDDPTGVASVVILKLAIAVALFGWYFMANREDWMRWSQVVTLAGVCLAGLFFILASFLAASN